LCSKIITNIIYSILLAFTQDMLNTQFNEIIKSINKEQKNIKEQLTKIDNNNFILVNLFHDFLKVYK